MKKFFLFLVITAIAGTIHCQTLPSKDERLEWWMDARFGMFIHWGPVSLTGEEISWSRGKEIPVEVYDTLYKQFNPTEFNAEEWVKLAKDAGMKYIVFTSKHHDGFCMWNTKYTDYNVMVSPFRRDVVKELAEACKKYDMAFGLYYSTCDWHHLGFPVTSPGGRVQRDTYNLDTYTEYLKNQSVELIQNYGPLLLLWYDVPQRFDSIRGQGVINRISEIQPDILVNDRTGASGDFNTPEQRVGNFQPDRPWETCMTIAEQWAWKPEDNVKSLEQCLHSLIRSAGGDGNLLFNVGPKPDGSIEPLQAERLKEMGKWLGEYGYTIYGTRGGPFKPTDWGVSTYKGNKIYLHILNWYGDNPRITIPEFGIPIVNCRFLNGDDMPIYRKDGNYIITFPGARLKPINTIIELEIAGDAKDIKPLDVISQSHSFQRKVTASSNPNPRWNDITSINNGDWFGHAWKPANDDKNPWVEIDLGKTQKVSKAILYENGNSIKAYELKYQDGVNWKTFFQGTTIGTKLEISFKPVNARKIMLVINGFSETPSVYEVVLL